jgi:hypothetical protein
LLTGLKGQVSARARIVDGNIIEFNPMRQNQSRQTQPSNCLQRVIRVSTFWIAFYLLLTVYYKYSLNSINIFNATIVIVVGSYVFSYMILDWVTIIYKLMKKLKLI